MLLALIILGIIGLCVAQTRSKIPWVIELEKMRPNILHNEKMTKLEEEKEIKK